MEKKEPSGWLQAGAVALPILLILGNGLLYFRTPWAVAYWAALFLLLLALAGSRAGREPRRQLTAWWAAFDTPGTRRTAAAVLLSTAAFSAAAHGFLFANEFFSHDSVSYFSYATGTFPFYVSIGRFLIPLYEVIKGAVAAPWLIGLLFTVWMSAASFLTVRLLKIRSVSGAVLVSGLLCTNIALTLTGATYVYCMDEYAMALLTAVAAAWMFSRGRRGILPGLLFLVISLLFYQAYFTVTLSLCFLVILEKLAENQRLASVIAEGVRDLVLMAAGFGLYYWLWTEACALVGMQKRRVEESLLSGGLEQLWTLLREANLEFGRNLLDADRVLGYFLPTIHLLLLGAVLFRLASCLADRSIRPGNRLVLLALACLTPTVLNSASILLTGGTTELVTVSWGLFYVLPAICREPGSRQWKACGRRAVGLLLCGVLWYNLVFANQAYMKKDLEKTATIAMAARVIERIELLDGYVPGETPVTFVGLLSWNTYLNRGRDEFQALDGAAGLWFDYAATYNMGRYLTDYLNYPLLWDETLDFSQREEVWAMPAFPAAGSIQMIDGTVVVKLS